MLDICHTYFTVPLCQSHKMPQGTASTPVKKTVMFVKHIVDNYALRKKWQICDHVALSASPSGLFC